MQIPIERYTLPNGMRVILSEDHTLPVVALNIWYDVGSRNEVPGRTGLAHLFEHMMFEGSRNVAANQHIGHVERVGGSGNASTWLDRTNYYETVPSSFLELILWLEADRLDGFVDALTQEKLDNQRDVVKNERRQRIDNAPYGDWDERVQRMMYPADHPYHHPVIGSMEDLDAASVQDVADFFRTYYAPNNGVLTLAGDFDPAEAKRLIHKYFAPIARGPEIPPLPGTPDPGPRLGGELRERVESDVLAPLPRVYVAYRIPIYGTDDFYALDVASELLAGGKSSRLYTDLVRESRIAQSVAAFTFPVVTGAAMMVARAGAHPGGDPDALERALLAGVESLATRAPDAGEVERAITAIEARQVIALQKLSERADQISQLTQYFDQPELVNTELDRYRRVTPEDVRRVAAEWLTADNRGVLTYVPATAARQEAA